MAATRDFDFLLIGKTGMGKSALGNSILKRDNRFLAIDSMSSVTTEVQFEYSEYKRKIIKVVDGPGVGDTRLNKPDGLKLFIEQMGKAMVMNPQGYHAFLLVIRYGARFTDEDKETIELLKEIFGPDFVRKYCILAMTHGDNFQSGDTFLEWCSHQTGVFQELLKECNNRIVLFDNATRDVEKRDAQLDKLLEMVSHLQCEGQRYTDENFQKAGASREKALVDSEKPIVEEQTLQEISLILQKLKDEKISFHYDKPITPFIELSERCNRLIENLKEQDKQTGSLQDPIQKVQNVKQSIDDAILIHSEALEEKRKMEEKEKKRRAEIENELQRKKQQMEKESREMMNLQKQHYENMIQQGKMDREQMEREFALTLQNIEKEKLQLEREAEDKLRKFLQTMKSEQTEHHLKMQKRNAEARARITDNTQHLDSALTVAKRMFTRVVLAAGVSFFLAVGMAILGSPTVAALGAGIAVQFTRMTT